MLPCMNLVIFFILYTKIWIKTNVMKKCARVTIGEISQSCKVLPIIHIGVVLIYI